MHQQAERQLQEQRDREFDRDITFSIATPLYNTPVEYLREMIESVQAPTYKNWELCLADGSDDAHKNVGEICKSYYDADSRIVYKKLEKNKGAGSVTYGMGHIDVDPVPVIGDHVMQDTLILIPV